MNPLSLVVLVMGGSVLAFLGYATGLSPAWGAAAGTLALLLVMLLGAEHQYFRAYEAAWAYAPTWERIQSRADTLRAIVEPQAGFRDRYVPTHMVATRSDYDKAVAAGFPPDFPRSSIPDADYEDALRLITALDQTVEQWRKAEQLKGTGR